MKTNIFYNGDCLHETQGMCIIEDKSVDLILCDLPYQTTKLCWDTLLPFDKLWEQYERIIKDNGAIVLFSAQPFTSKLIISNPKLFRYEVIWQKKGVTGFVNAKKMPLKSHENICIFYKKLPTYNPQGLRNCHIEQKERKMCEQLSVFAEEIRPESLNSTQAKFTGKSYTQTKTNYPRSVWKFGKDEKTFHPTQKPLELIKEIILTYSNEGDLVLDNCAGSATTLRAADILKRKWIGWEKDPTIYKISNNLMKSL